MSMNFGKSTTKKILAKIETLLDDIEQHGALVGLGKPEALKGDLTGFYSRRNDSKHRLVYTMDGENVVILRCKSHYGEK